MLKFIGLGMLLVSALALDLAGCQGPGVNGVKPPPPVAASTFGTIVRKDPRFDKLIPTSSQLEKLSGGFEWSEGPLWIREGAYVLFSDIPKNAVMMWKEGVGTSVFLEKSGYTGTTPRNGESGSNGLLLDAQGRLVLCEHGDRRVARVERDGKKTTLADRFGGKRLNSPNDAVLKSNGDIYFTDPPYGLEKQIGDPARELNFQGVFRISTKGELTLLTKEVSMPNGIAFSPDEKKLYVANSDPENAVWFQFDVNDDGTIANRKTFFDATAWVKEGRAGLPDGLKVDRRGNLFATGPGGLHVFAPDGAHLGTIDTGGATANCAWGGDGSVLYITADMNLLRIKTGTKGEGF